MNAAEMIRAAIDRLTELRESATTGPWLGWKQYNPLYGERYGIETGQGGDEVFAGSCARADVELVETLHRTIDAQLAFLRHSLTPEKFHGWDTFSNDACMLAEAILGGAK